MGTSDSFPVKWTLNKATTPPAAEVKLTAADVPGADLRKPLKGAHCMRYGDCRCADGFEQPALRESDK